MKVRALVMLVAVVSCVALAQSIDPATIAKDLGTGGVNVALAWGCVIAFAAVAGMSRALWTVMTDRLADKDAAHQQSLAMFTEALSLAKEQNELVADLRRIIELSERRN